MIDRAKPGLLPIAAVVFLALASGAQANPMSQAPTSGRPSSDRPTSDRPTSDRPTSDRPTTEPAQANGSGQSGSPTQVGPVPSAPEAAPSVSSSEQESRSQAMTRRDQPGDGAQSGVVAESTATAQGIWQVQISSCTAHCHGTSQLQTAKQRNTTAQALKNNPRSTGNRRPRRGAARGHRSMGHDWSPGSHLTSSPNTSSSLNANPNAGLTQIQLGCLSHCFGTTTRTRQLPAQAPRPTLPELLDTIARAMPSLQDIPAAEQATVVQTSHQWQYGSGTGPGQTQTATQVSTTVQSHDVPLTDAARSVLGDYVPRLVNQTEQGIWQLQIGCLAFCSQTRQVQLAEQSNTTMRSAGGSRDSSSSPPTSSVNVTTQTIWQVQVGCLIWCFDTEQQQTASSENSEGELPGEEAAEATPPSAGTPSSAGTPPPAGTPAPGGSPSAAGTPPPAGSPPGNPCDRSPVPTGCNPIAGLGGARPRATDGPAGPSSKPANRTRRAGPIATPRSGWINEERSGRTVTARAHAAGASASVAISIYRTGVARTPARAPHHTMGSGTSGSDRRQSSRISRSLAAGISSAAESGPGAPPIALVAAIALCMLAAARAFRSEPFPRRRATEK